MDQEIRDKVIATHTIMEGVSETLIEIKDTLKNHEKRISKSEMFRSWFIGLFSASIGGGSTFAAFKHFIGGDGHGG